MASAVYKNLEQLLKISNQVECHESGMSRSNSKKSYVDVETLYNKFMEPVARSERHQRRGPKS